MPRELKRKREALQKKQPFHHNVYVALLSDAVAKHRSILRLNPKRYPLKPCLYVGMTGIPVVRRFENHRNERDPVVRYNYRLGVRESGFYREVINTDGETYGGSNVGHFGGIQSEAREWMGREHSILVHLPPLATLAFKFER